MFTNNKKAPFQGGGAPTYVGKGMRIEGKIWGTRPIWIDGEVKGSIDLLNGGPSSYGPTENWDEIYFVDAVENNDKIYTIYQVKLSSTSEKWKNITVSKTQTFADQCLLGRRPRLTFKELRSQLGEDCKLFFRGHLSEMF